MKYLKLLLQVFLLALLSLLFDQPLPRSANIQIDSLKSRTRDTRRSCGMLGCCYVGGPKVKDVDLSQSEIKRAVYGSSVPARCKFLFRSPWLLITSGFLTAYSEELFRHRLRSGFLGMSLKGRSGQEIHSLWAIGIVQPLGHLVVLYGVETDLNDGRQVIWFQIRTHRTRRRFQTIQPMALNQRAWFYVIVKGARLEWMRLRQRRIYCPKGPWENTKIQSEMSDKPPEQNSVLVSISAFGYDCVGVISKRNSKTRRRSRKSREFHDRELTRAWLGAMFF